MGGRTRMTSQVMFLLGAGFAAEDAGSTGSRLHVRNSHREPLRGRIQCH
jgi:hypothetical protein